MHRPDDLILLHRISDMISFAEYLPMEMISQRNSEPVYPVTVGEHLVNYMLDILLKHTWESESLENAAEPLESILNQLDTGVDHPDTWKELFAANMRLKEILSQEEDHRQSI